MKKWSDMTDDEKGNNIRQCAEAGYGWGFTQCDCKMDWLQNLRTGYENDPNWFGFEIAEYEWDGFGNVLAVYADELAQEIDSDEYDFDVNDFEKRSGLTASSVAAKYITDWHYEGLDYTYDDVVFAMNDLYTKL